MTAENKISNPHDKVVRDQFSEPKNAILFFEKNLPEKVTKLLDLKNLQIVQGTFIDEKFDEFKTDILYEVSLKESKKLMNIYLLFEHKSYPDKNIIAQLFSYISNIYAKTKSYKLVVPFVFVHGEKQWNLSDYSLDFFELSENEKEVFSKYIPKFHYELCDIRDKNIENLTEYLTFYSFMYLIKHSHEENIFEYLQILLENVSEMFEDRGNTKSIFQLIRYMLELLSNDKSKIQENIVNLKSLISRTVSTEQGENVMSVAEALRKEGEIKGKLEGKLESARNMLQDGLPLDSVLKYTSLTKENLIEAGLLKN